MFAQVIAPSREFPEGRFYNNTVAKKDAWVRDMYNHILGRRKGIEKSKTLKKAGTCSCARSWLLPPRCLLCSRTARLGAPPLRSRLSSVEDWTDGKRDTNPLLIMCVNWCSVQATTRTA